MFEVLYKLGKRVVETQVHYLIEENTADYIRDAVKEVKDDISYVRESKRKSRFEGSSRFESRRFK